MKLFISADMEGLANVITSSELNREHPDYAYYAEWMSKEVAEVANTALKKGFNAVTVKDGHASGRNIIPSYMPSKSKLLRGWTGDPLLMMAGLDNSYDAVAFVGYHSAAGHAGNPLAHTVSGSKISYLKINDNIASEFLLNAYTAAYYDVPIVAISGDASVCRQAKEYIPSIITIPVKEGIGSAAISLSEQDTLDLIKKNIGTLNKKTLSDCKLYLPEVFNIELRFTRYPYAYQASFYPGVTLKDEYTITFKTDDYYEFLRMFLFVMKN